MERGGRTGAREALLLRPGRGALVHYRLSWALLAVLVAFALWGLVYFGSSPAERALLVVLLLLLADGAAALVRSRRRLAPVRLSGGRICLRERCRDLDRLESAAFELRNNALVAGFREGYLVLRWRDETWLLPLALCGWERLWERLSGLRPDLELGPWQDDPVVLRVLAAGRDTPVCVPAGVRLLVGKAGWLAEFSVWLAAVLLSGVAIGLLRAHGVRVSDWIGGALATWLGMRAWRSLRRVRLSYPGRGDEPGAGT